MFPAARFNVAIASPSGKHGAHFFVDTGPITSFIEPNIEMGVQGGPHVSTSDDHCASEENVTIEG